jgi:hypothetical protein
LCGFGSCSNPGNQTDNCTGTTTSSSSSSTSSTGTTTGTGTDFISTFQLQYTSNVDLTNDFGYNITFYKVNYTEQSILVTIGEVFNPTVIKPLIESKVKASTGYDVVATVIGSDVLIQESTSTTDSTSSGGTSTSSGNTSGGSTSTSGGSTNTSGGSTSTSGGSTSTSAVTSTTPTGTGNGHYLTFSFIGFIGLIAIC